MLAALLLPACSTHPPALPDNHDSSLIANDTAIGRAVQEETMPEGLLFKDNETFFKALVEKKFVAGELIDIAFITDNLVSDGGTDPSKYSVALIRSGEGTYAGPREGIQYATIHCLLAVFKQVNEEQLFRDFRSLGDVESQGLISGDIEAEPIEISGNHHAVLIHFKSSEEGAGDYGFRKDDASLYVFVNNKLTSVLDVTLDDFEFSSDEQGSYRERTRMTEFKILETQTDGFNDISLLTTTSISVTGEEESTDETPSADASAEATSPTVYKWNGARYAAVE
jgi:hypothetical protein